MGKPEIRVLLRHYWKQGFNATAAAKKICEIEGDNVVSDRTAQDWFQRFNDGDIDLEDKTHSGRPTTVDSEAAKKATKKA